MTDFNDEQNGNENEQNQGENLNQEGQTENQEEGQNEEPRVFTQEELNQIISERIAEVQTKSAAELNQFRSQAEEVIANLSRAAAEQRQTRQVQDVEDEPEPANMNPNEKLLWDSNRPTRLAMKRMLQNASAQLSQSVAPILHDQTVKNFFSSRSNIPDSVKKSTNDIFQNAVRNGNRAPAEQLVVAAYTQALAQYAEQGFSGGNQGGNQSQGGTTKPKVIVKAPNGSADIGGGTRSITGKIGGGRSSSGKSYRELRDELIKEGAMPDRGAGGTFK